MEEYKNCVICHFQNLIAKQVFNQDRYFFYKIVNVFSLSLESKMLSL